MVGRSRGEGTSLKGRTVSQGPNSHHLSPLAYKNNVCNIDCILVTYQWTTLLTLINKVDKMRGKSLNDCVPYAAELDAVFRISNSTKELQLPSFSGIFLNSYVSEIYLLFSNS